jgi:tripartite-type tricarboxylate transporter receptor subunit TctC
MTTLSSAIPHVQAGRLRALGVTSAETADQLPGVPPIGTTLAGFDNKGWFGIVAPAGTPQEIVQKIYRDTRKALDDATFRARFSAMGLTPIGDTPEEMARAMEAESQRYAAVAKARKLKVQ